MREHHQAARLVEFGSSPLDRIVELFTPDGDLDDWREALEKMLLEFEDEMAH